MQSNSYLPTTMRWSKAKMRGQSGNGEEINKMMNRLLYLLVLLHPREIAQEKQEATFKTSLERKLSERSRESKNSLVSEQNILEAATFKQPYYLKLKHSTSNKMNLMQRRKCRKKDGQQDQCFGVLQDEVTI